MQSASAAIISYWNFNDSNLTVAMQQIHLRKPGRLRRMPRSSPLGAADLRRVAQEGNSLPVLSATAGYSSSKR